MRVERESDPLSPAAAASALMWWADAGVDVIVGEEPHDWLRPKTAPEKIAAETPVPVAGGKLPGQLDLFQAYLLDNQSLSFSAPAAPRVCPAGDPTSGLMIVSDMPAAQDCADGLLLSGETGRLFDRMLAAIGRDRESIYLASLSCLRSPTGGFTGESAARCAELARHHIGLVAPKAVLLLGDTCGKALLGQAVMQGRGRWHEISTHAGQIPTMLSFHPAGLLDRPSFKAAAWADLQMLMQRLNP